LRHTASQMFNFGSPEQSAALRKDQAVAMAGGPGIIEKDATEMTTAELKQAITYDYMILREAIKDGEDDAVVQLLQDTYLNTFKILCSVDQVFRSAVIEGNHSKVPDYGNIKAADYRAIAIAANSES